MEFGGAASHSSTGVYLGHPLVSPLHSRYMALGIGFLFFFFFFSLSLYTNTIGILCSAGWLFPSVHH